MNNEADRGGIGKLWSGETPKEKPARRETEHVAQIRPARAYAAFEVRQEHPQRLHICCATQPSRYPAYSSLLDIIHERDFDRAFTLVYSFMLVEVTGNHLGAIVHAIANGNCARITEYHAKLYDRPGADAPIIESVKVTAAIGATEP